MFRFFKRLLIQWWKKRNSPPLPEADTVYVETPRKERLHGLEKVAAQLKSFKETVDRYYDQ